jgi:hypothetical protein
MGLADRLKGITEIILNPLINSYPYSPILSPWDPRIYFINN